MTSVLVLLLGLILFAVPLAWIHRTRGGEFAERGRFGAIILAYGIAAVALGLSWLPPAGAIDSVERASAQIGGGRGRVTCAEAPSAMQMVRDVSAGNVEITPRGDLLIASPVWSRLDRDQQASVLDLVGQIVRCMRSARGPVAVRIIDRDSQRLLQTRTL